MLEPSRQTQSSPRELDPSLLQSPSDTLQAAKWPPEDGGHPESGPGDLAGGGAALPPDGNFRRGRFGLKAGLVAVMLAALGIGLVYYGVHREEHTMTVEQKVAEQKRLFQMPQDQSVVEWRKWAANSDDVHMQRVALIQLAWLNDKEAVGLATQALSSSDHSLRGVAAQVLAKFGSPSADSSKPTLLKALGESDNRDEPQIAWALVELKDTSAFDRVLKVYRAGHLAKVQRIDEGSAFNPEKLAKLMPPEKWASYATDESPSVRQLAATILSQNAEPRFTDALIKLVQDPEVEVAREAASGLGKIGDERARRPLLEALGKADKESRKKFLEALRDGIGGQGLVLALDSVDKSKPETEWYQTSVIFGMLAELSDPRAGDLLVAYADKAKGHWRTEAAMRLAEIGDVRAVKYLAERLPQDTAKLYGDSELPEEKALVRDDKERMVGARMLADLATLHPESLDMIREQAEKPMLQWLTSMPQPQANGLRFLAAVNSDFGRGKLREWAFPKASLPREGQQPPMPQEWVVAQSALRYLGRMKDAESWGKFEQQLDRRKAEAHDVDVTMNSLMGGGLALLGMSVRALGVGVADGYAEWGDPKAYPVLTKFIENKLENEQARVQSCFALGWVAPEDKVPEIAKKVTQFASTKDERDQFIAACYTEALARHPVASANAELIKLLTPQLDPLFRLNIAQALGFAGLSPADEALLQEKLKDKEVRVDAALALILGGNTETATRTVAAFADFPEEAMAQLRDNYFRVFGYWSDRDFDEGRLFRWIDNAETIRRLRVRDAPQEWAAFLLQRQLNNLQIDNGPHSMTRVVLRYRLYDLARKGDASKQAAALKALRFMGEQGVLMALKAQGGELGQKAADALFLLMNRKAVVDVAVPETKTGGAKILPPSAN